jgi:hypothetical protein
VCLILITAITLHIAYNEVRPALNSKVVCVTRVVFDFKPLAHIVLILRPLTIPSQFIINHQLYHSTRYTVGDFDIAARSIKYKLYCLLCRAGYMMS